MSPEFDVASFGETMLRLSTARGERLERAGSFETFVAGSESNTLACLARLGLRCAWSSALPPNPLGRRIAAELRGYGVDVGYVVWSGSRVGLYYTEEAPPPLGVRTHYDRAGSACAEIEPAALDLAMVDRARLLHLTGITLAIGAGARRAFERLLVRAVETQTPISFDVNYRAKLWSPESAAEGVESACRSASLLFCTSQDAAELWGLTGDSEHVLRSLATRFGAADDDEDARTYVLTLGAAGSARLHNGVYEAAPVVPTEGDARFGSGDAFSAGYICAHLEGELYVRAREEFRTTPLQFGNALAALKRCIPGDIASVAPDEVLEVLRGGVARFR